MLKKTQPKEPPRAHIEIKVAEGGAQQKGRKEEGDTPLKKKHPDKKKTGAPGQGVGVKRQQGEARGN